MANNYSGDPTVRPLEKLILKFAQPRGYDVDKVFTGLLDYIIWQLDPEEQPIQYWAFKEGEGAAFAEMMMCLLQILNEEIPKRGWYDAFGDLFMSLHAAGNSKGQFFTPPHVCTMMSRCILHEAEPKEWELPRTPFGRRLTMNDPTCGSSRLLLAGASVQMKVMQEDWGYDYAKAMERRPYLCAEDIDMNCVKMSAINIALHGYFGECVCHDTLCNPGGVDLAFIINETQWPFYTPVPSIRREMRPECLVSTSRYLAMKAATDRKKSEDVLPLGGGEQSQESGVSDFTPETPLSDPVQVKEKKQAVQLELF